MDARFLDMLHYSTNYRGCAVGDSININLNGIAEELVYQYWMSRGNVYRLVDEGFKLLLFVDDLHGPTTEDV